MIQINVAREHHRDLYVPCSLAYQDKLVFYFNTLKLYEKKVEGS